MAANRKPGPGFYRRPDVVRVARELLGKLLCCRADGKLCKAVITETEAYAGEGDRASHASGGRRTPRTEILYAAGGCAYVYLCYGIHHLFNVVTHDAGVPHAVLVRAAYPLRGVATMQARRGKELRDRRLLAGPGMVAQGLGITTALNGASLRGRQVWIEDAGIEPAAADISAGPRIGVDYAGADAKLPYRFVWSDEGLARAMRGASG